MILFFTNIATLSKSTLLFWSVFASTLCVCSIFHSVSILEHKLSFFAVILPSFMKISNSCLDCSQFNPTVVDTLNTPNSLVALTVLVSPFLVFSFQVPSVVLQQ